MPSTLLCLQMWPAHCSAEKGSVLHLHLYLSPGVPTWCSGCEGCFPSTSLGQLFCIFSMDRKEKVPGGSSEQWITELILAALSMLNHPVFSCPRNFISHQPSHSFLSPWTCSVFNRSYMFFLLSLGSNGCSVFPSNECWKFNWAFDVHSS